MAKKTFKKEQIIIAYTILKDAKLSKLDTVSDKLKVVDALRMMRPVAKAHDEDLETARETLRPEALTETQRKIKEDNEISQLDMVRSTILNNEYGEALSRYVRERLAEEVEIDLVAFGKPCLDQLIEANPGWTPEQLMVVIDVLG